MCAYSDVAAVVPADASVLIKAKDQSKMADTSINRQIIRAFLLIFKSPRLGINFAINQEEFNLRLLVKYFKKSLTGLPTKRLRMS